MLFFYKLNSENKIIKIIELIYDRSNGIMGILAGIELPNIKLRREIVSNIFKRNKLNELAL